MRAHGRHRLAASRAVRVSVYATRTKDLATICLYRGGGFNAFRFMDDRDMRRTPPDALPFHFEPGFEGNSLEQQLSIVPALSPAAKLELRFVKRAGRLELALTAADLLRSLEAREWVA